MNFAAYLNALNCMRCMNYHEISLVSSGGQGFQPIHMAALKGNIDIIQYLIDNDVDINTQSLNGTTPLLISVQTNQPQLLKFLIQNGAIPKSFSSKSPSPLITAVKNNFIDIINILEQSKTDPEERDHEGNSVLHMAIKTQNLNLIRFFSPLFERFVNEPNEMGETPFLLSCKYCDIFIITMLIEKGADFNKKDYENNNSLHYGVESKNIEKVAFILQNAPCLVSKKNKKDQYPIHIAASIGILPIFQILFEANPSIGMKPFTNTVFHIACKKKHLEIIKFLCNTPEFPYETENDMNIREKINKQLFILQLDQEAQKFFYFYFRCMCLILKFQILLVFK